MKFEVRSWKRERISEILISNFTLHTSNFIAEAMQLAATIKRNFEELGM